uniref:Decapping nuclease n=1 Tax=Acrobeloides nanus TaxID=290746 RepID=A0A914C0E8_9BILA
MDCVDSEGKDMEIKTEFGNVNRNNPKLHRKYLKWYIQSYLVGIQNIVVGKKVDDTHVNKVAIYDLEDLRRQGQKHWNLDKCMTFLHDYLKTVKNELDTKPEGEILLTKYDPSYQTKVNFTWESANSAYAFLPEEFKQRFAI